MAGRTENWASFLEKNNTIPFMEGKSTYSEDEILEGCRKNDRHFQEVFYKKHFDMMFGLCKSRIRDGEEAMLVVNDAFLKAFKNIGQYSHKGSVGAWLRRILFNAIADYYRKIKPTHMAEELVEKVNKVLVLNGQALNDLYFEDLVRLIEEMPNTTREVFTLFAVDGYTHADIAEKLGIPEGSSKWQLHQARKLLKAKLERLDRSDQKLKLRT